VNESAYQILLGVAVLVALLFTIIVLLTSKGDAMSGGGQIRTTFKGGRATIDDQINKLTFYLGVGFVSLMLILDFVGHKS